MACRRLQSVTIHHVIHRFSNLLAGLALLLGLAMAVLWCRSLGTEDQWRMERHDAGVWKTISINSRRGEVAVVFGSVSYGGAADPAPLRVEFNHQALTINSPDSTVVAPATHLGFGYGQYLPTAPPGEICKITMVLVPHWLFLLPAVLAGIRFARKTVRHQRPTA